ncbi:DUF5682 family protein [Niveibacterium terrae]|uniref:DUF5682 family protein n=1 Tax=Niveibacterium terrae TaxID=3373598 RepID=UPI003A91286D
MSLTPALPPGDAAERVAEARTRLFGERDVYFAPVRHHSPACALALRQMLRELKPAAVLIEGPDDIGALLPLLNDPQTRAPVAILCQATRTRAVEEADAGEKTRPETRSSFYPFCDYSPEWVAAREGFALGAELALIDLPWRDKAWEGGDESQAAQSLMEERHFAHSAYLGAMAARLGCVDHDELWDRLFELRAPDTVGEWRSFFGDVFHWCAMARLDYEPEVLEAELSLPRERHMAAHIRAWRERLAGNIVVVTGGFHTPELLSAWQTAKPRRAKEATEKTAPGAWLIRYSFEQLDALNGYASGMPSPAYYQCLWEAFERKERDPFAAVALDMLTRFARKTREDDLSDAVSTALVQAAAVQAMRLAELRGNPGPGRQDLLDAIRSCFVKGAIDEGTRGFTADLRRFLGGSRIGDVPPSAGSPPLIEDARRRARAAGVRLDDSTPHIARLDLYRKPSHRERSRFFHAMTYLDAGLATKLSGPDFLGNSRLNLLFEEWRAAWSPLVEARLIELAADGATLETVCMARLAREEAALFEAGRARSAATAVMLLVRACLIGLHARLPQLLQMLSTHLDEDASLASVVESGHRLSTLWQAREPLGVQRNPQLFALLERIWPTALFLLPDLASCDEASEARAVQNLLSLRELGRQLGAIEDGAGIDLAQLHQHLDRFATGAGLSPAIAGASAALLFLEGVWSEASLEAVVHARFGAGAEQREAVRFLNGMLNAAPELLLRLPSLLAGMDALIAGWDEADFVAYLPDLRQVFTRLRPQDTAELAGCVAGLHGQRDGSSLAEIHYDTSEEDLAAGLQLQRALEDKLRRDGLDAWIH